MEKLSCSFRGLLLLFLLSFGLFYMTGCDKLSTKMVDHFNQVKKDQEKLDQEMKVQGDNNKLLFQKFSEKLDITISNSTKISKQIKEGAEITAKDIGKLHQEWNSNKNSGWMIFGIVISVVLPCMGLVYMVIKLSLTNRARKNLEATIKDVIDSDDNNLTDEIFKIHKKE